jgi:hypothetical protein
MSEAAGAYTSGERRREYRDHRLEWMVKSGGIDVVLAGPATTPSASPGQTRPSYNADPVARIQPIKEKLLPLRPAIQDIHHERGH